MTDRIEDRIPNETGGEHCEWCCDDGMVPVAVRPPGIDEYGPCPACEKGHRYEFGPSGSKLWPRGYWQGRPFGQVVQKQCACKAKITRDPEEARQWLAMVKDMQERALGTVTDGIRDARPLIEPAAETEEAKPVEPVIPEQEDTGSHDCPHLGKIVPWPVEECASCSPEEPGTEPELTL